MARLSQLNKNIQTTLQQIQSAGSSQSVSGRQMGQLLSDHAVSNSQRQTLPRERLAALEQCVDLLYELTVPELSPRVSKRIRTRARQILRHYPTEQHLEEIARAVPHLLNRVEDPLYDAVKGYKESDPPL